MPRNPVAQPNIAKREIFSPPPAQGSKRGFDNSLGEKISENLLQQKHQQSRGGRYVSVETGEFEIADFDESGENDENVFAQTDNRFRRMLAGTILAVLLFLAGGMSYTIYLSSAQVSPADMYAGAEACYNAKNFTAALSSYKMLVETYPENSLSELATQKISLINEEFAFVAKYHQGKQSYVNDLLMKARSAFESQNYVIPADDNALLHCSQLLEVVPNHSEATQMRAFIFNYYDKMAATAVRKRRYKSAHKYYESMLTVLPGNKQILEKISQLDRR